jgi:hypothetical protein
VDSLEWLPHIPAKWRRVIRQMMADDPAARYQNCEQLLAAFADLPVESDWECFVSDDLIAWSRQQKKRVHKVEWIRHSPRKHEWRAWTEPVDQGRQKTMGGSDGIIGGTSCLNELKSYFASC